MALVGKHNSLKLLFITTTYYYYYYYYYYHHHHHYYYYYYYYYFSLEKGAVLTNLQAASRLRCEKGGHFAPLSALCFY